MISQLKRPTTKYELARAVSALQNPKIEVFEVVSSADVREVQKALDRYDKAGPYTVVLVRT